MVCNRCIRVVREELTALGFPVKTVELGKAIVDTELTREELTSINEVLIKNGFELIDDKRSRIIERVKTLIIETIHHDAEKPAHINFSTYLAKELAYDYSYLSRLFSAIEGITIEKYIVLQKIEKVKELLVYDELSLSEIAYRLGYSSVQHLSMQFKKTTGFPPSHFKKLKSRHRKSIDKL